MARKLDHPQASLYLAFWETDLIGTYRATVPLQGQLAASAWTW